MSVSMSTNPLVSIIVPVYNVERYLARCIQSLVKQSYKQIEVILIDDGSSDSSPQLCDRFANQYEMVKTVHEQNRGVSAARNKGLDIATGDFILFVDSDDVVNVNYVQSFIDKHMQADLVIGSIKDIYVNQQGDVYEQRRRVHKAPQRGILREEYYKLLEFLRVPVGKLYKKDIIDAHQLRFNEVLSIAEDQVFNFSYYRYIKSYVLSTQSVYQYYHFKSVRSLSALLTEKTFSDDIFKLNIEYDFLKDYQATNWNSIYTHQLISLLNKYAIIQKDPGFIAACGRMREISKVRPLSTESVIDCKKKLIIYFLKLRLYWLIALYYRMKAVKTIFAN